MSNSDFIISRPRSGVTAETQETVKVRVVAPDYSDKVYEMDRERAVQVIRDLRYFFDITAVEIM